MIRKTLATALATTALSAGFITSAHADEDPVIPPPITTPCEVTTFTTEPAYSWAGDETGTVYHTTTVKCPTLPPVITVYTYTQVRDVPLTPSPNNIPPCKQEDGSGQRICVWDARHRGNGVGHSFISIREGGMTFTKRIKHRKAHRLVAIWKANH